MGDWGDLISFWGDLIAFLSRHVSCVRTQYIASSCGHAALARATDGLPYLGALRLITFWYAKKTFDVI